MARVLVVDDQADVLETIASMVEYAGHAVTRAANGQDALEAFVQQPADLVVTDVRMSGFAYIGEIRARSPELPIIALSGYASSSEYLVAARDVGVSCILAKPLSLDKLMEVLEAFLPSE